MSGPDVNHCGTLGLRRPDGDLSVVELDPGSVSRQGGKCLQRTPDGSLLPEPRRLGDDQHIASTDAHFDRTHPVAECVANLPLDLPLDGCVGHRLRPRIILVPTFRRGASRLVPTWIGGRRLKEATEQARHSPGRGSWTGGSTLRIVGSSRSGSPPGHTGRDRFRPFRRTARRSGAPGFLVGSRLVVEGLDGKRNRRARCLFRNALNRGPGRRSKGRAEIRRDQPWKAPRFVESPRGSWPLATAAGPWASPRLPRAGQVPSHPGSPALAGPGRRRRRERRRGLDGLGEAGGLVVGWGDRDALAFGGSGSEAGGSRGGGSWASARLAPKKTIPNDPTSSASGTSSVCLVWYRREGNKTPQHVSSVRAHPRNPFFCLAGRDCSPTGLHEDFLASLGYSGRMEHDGARGHSLDSEVWRCQLVANRDTCIQCQRSTVVIVTSFTTSITGEVGPKRPNGRPI